MTWKDKFQHMGICFVVTLAFGWRAGGSCGITIEGTQAWMYYGDTGNLRDYDGLDTFIDLMFDAVGCIVGQILRNRVVFLWEHGGGLW